MRQLAIGDWVQRVYALSGYAATKWHLVDSVVAGAAITRCGRRMESHTPARSGNRLEASPVRPLTRAIGQPQLCKRCDGAVAA